MFNIKFSFYFALFLSLVFIGLINFDEELLFLLTFITIVFTAVRLFGQSLALQLDASIASIVKDFVILASSKSLSLSSVKAYGSHVGALAEELESLVLYTYNSVHSFAEGYQDDFNRAFQLLKHKQLKLLVLEGLQLAKLLYVRRFLMYWRELKDQLLLQGSSVSYLPVSVSADVPFLAGHLNTYFANLSDEESSDSISDLDLISLMVLLRIVNNSLE